MHFIGNSFAYLQGWVGSFSIEAFATILRPEWIEEALAAHGRWTRRQRKLPARFVAWLIIALGLYRSLSIRNVVHRLGSILGVSSLWAGGEEPSSSAIVEARDRLGFGVLRTLLGRLGLWLVERYRDAMSWKGMLLVCLDGTTLKLPDSPENRRRFGLPGVNRGGRAAFPQLRAAFLISPTHRFILGAQMAPYRRSELDLARRLLPDLPARSLMIIDRLYLAWDFLLDLRRRDHHFVLRLRRGVQIRRLERLGPGDHLVQIQIPRPLRRQHPHSPKHALMREVVVRIQGTWMRYLTSLLDSKAYPLAEVLRLYRQRWEEEISFDEIKTHQGATTTVNRPVLLRSQSSRRVLQEAYGLFISYNLIRCVIAQAAHSRNVDPLRISFVDSIERIREAALLMAAAHTRDLPRIYQGLLQAVARCVLPPRRARRNPREVCIKMSAYSKKWKKPA